MPEFRHLNPGYSSTHLFARLLYYGLFLLSLVAFPSCEEYQHPDLRFWENGEITGNPPESYTQKDSLLRSLTGLPARRQLDSLLLWAEILRNYDAQTALEYALRADQLATKEDMQFSRAISLYYIAVLKGRIQFSGESLDIPITYTKISRQLFNQTKRTDWQIRTNILLGDLYYQKGFFNRSHFDSALQVLSIAQELLQTDSASNGRQSQFQAVLSHSLANVYSVLDSSSLAVAHFQKSANLYREAGNTTAVSRVNISLGQFYADRKSFALADSLFQASIDYATSNGDNYNLIQAYLRYSRIKINQYRRSKDSLHFEQAMKMLKHCLYTQRNGQPENMYYTYRLTGRAYQSRSARGGPASDVDSALVNYKLAMETARAEGAIAIFKQVALEISKICDWLATKDRNCSEILDNPTVSFIHSNYAGVVDTISNNQQLASQQFLDFQLATQEDISERKASTQRSIFSIGLVFAILVFLLLLQRQQQKRLQARMDALRAQINPHFISNSLNAIENLVNQDQRQAASKYLIHFSRLTRKILNSSLDSTTTLAEELQTLKHFLALEQLRFRDKLQYNIKVSDELDADQIKIPAMILQPYVENAILHGIKPKVGVGNLVIEAKKVDQQLICIVEDDGIGREKARQLKQDAPMQQKSVGMEITDKRLRAISKVKGSRVNIEDLYDEAGKARGTRVVVKIPLLAKNAKK